jgi:hypothetical protein
MCVKHQRIPCWLPQQKTAARNHAGTLFSFPTTQKPRVEDGYYTNAVTSNKSRFVFFYFVCSPCFFYLTS